METQCRDNACVHVQTVATDTTWVHCSINLEALAAKAMPDSLKDVLDTIVKIVNFVNLSGVGGSILTSG